MIARIYMTLSVLANALALIKMDILVNEKADITTAVQFGLGFLLFNALVSAVFTLGSWVEDYLRGW